MFGDKYADLCPELVRALLVRGIGYVGIRLQSATAITIVRYEEMTL
ncbi:hypothetical protein [Vibrio aerogenes]|nr:hypothetical protein [Vibrio aerogenes]